MDSYDVLYIYFILKLMMHHVFLVTQRHPRKPCKTVWIKDNKCYKYS